MKFRTRGTILIFSKHLCDQVKNEYIFQLYNRDYVTMTELFGAVRKQVSNMAKNDFKQDMTPVHGKVLLQHLKEQCCGQMLFFKPGLNTANLGIASWGGGGGGSGRAVGWSSEVRWGGVGWRGGRGGDIHGPVKGTTRGFKGGACHLAPSRLSATPGENWEIHAPRES